MEEGGAREQGGSQGEQGEGGQAGQGVGGQGQDGVVGSLNLVRVCYFTITGSASFS